MSSNKNRGLGRGLEGLLAVDVNDPAAQLQDILLKDIIRNEAQPRQLFDEALLQELADSISQHGVLQPILLRPMGKKYQIVVGERRWRAAQLAGLTTIPAVVRELGERETAEFSLIENLQRENLNPVEEALAYSDMIEKFSYTQEELSASLGKSRSYIANMVRLLDLPPEILDMLGVRSISVGHARALLALKNSDDQLRVANKIISDKLSVREVEQLVKKIVTESGPPKRQTVIKTFDLNNNAALQQLEEKLQESLSTKVSIAGIASRGIIRVEYYTEEELNRLVELLGVKL